MIYVIGDSHSLYCFQNLPWYEVRHIGPRTAYKLPDHHDIVFGQLKDLKDNPVIIFVFGEIDCRYHVYSSYRSEGIPILRAIRRIAERYTDYVASLRKMYDIRIFQVVPCGTKGNIHNFPFFASRPVRQLIFRVFRHEIARCCKEEGIPVLDVSDSLEDETGERLPELVYEDTHLTNKVGLIVWERYFKEPSTLKK